MTEYDPLTADEMFDCAEAALDSVSRYAEEALYWLHPDWQPLGFALTEQQESRRRRLREVAVAIRRGVELATREAT